MPADAAATDGGRPCGLRLREPEDERGAGPEEAREALDLDLLGDDLDLERQEAEITKEVPTLFESMNRSSEDINSLEGQVGEAQERHRRLLVQWSRHYDDSRAQCGKHIDKTRPYFEAADVLTVAARQAQGTARRFSAAAARHEGAKAELAALELRARGALDGAQQDELSRAIVRVCRCGQERESTEREHGRLLVEYQEAQRTADALRKKVGSTSIRKAQPFFQLLQAHQAELATEQHRISALEENARACKGVYSKSMQDLSNISNAVHEARRKSSADLANKAQTPKAESEPDPEASPDYDCPGADTRSEEAVSEPITEGTGQPH